MTIMLPGKRVSKAGYIARGAVALGLIICFALWMISRSAGTFTSTAKIFTEIPTAAGLITAGSPVRYNGVKVGEIGDISAGRTSSRVTLNIDKKAVKIIPTAAKIRIVPRTFFGDIYVQFVNPQASPGATLGSVDGLRSGNTVPIDNGPDAVNLYNLFTKLSSLLAEVQPEKMTLALSAVDRAIGKNGDQLGIMIDDWWSASKELEATLDRFLATTPRFRAVVESLERATPDVLKTLASTSNISQGIVNHKDKLAAFLTAASGFAQSVSTLIAEQKKNLITIIDSTAIIFSTVAKNPDGLSTTLRAAEKFGAAGKVLFSTGRFNITAVPTFSQPMPYTGADCPTYGTLRGNQCTGTGTRNGVGPVRAPGEPNGKILGPHPSRNTGPKPGTHPASSSVINGAAEASTLVQLEAALQGKPAQSQHNSQPNPLTTLMVGPMIRGTEVKIS